jgi:hypothetical protein
VPELRTAGPKVGRIFFGGERIARQADEVAAFINDEVLRTAFAISRHHAVAAWHCVREPENDEAQLWLRLRQNELQQPRHYVYLPLRVSNYDAEFDVAALALDESRLPQAGLSTTAAEELLAQHAIPLGVGCTAGERVQIIGFPLSSSAADSDTNSAEVVDTELPLGNVVGLKLYSPAFAAVSPVDPHGLSGAPVLRLPSGPGEPPSAAIGVIRAIPRGSLPGAAIGGGIIATRFEDVAESLPEVAVALAANRAALIGRTHDFALRRNVRVVSRACWQALRESVIVIDDPVRGKLTGWAHFFDEVAAHARPTAISTAYGLKLALTLDDPDGTIRRSDLAETLWRLQLPDGGWTARTGSGVGRPETSALVLGALATAGSDSQRVGEATKTLEQSLAPAFDPMVRQRTYVLCAAIRV